VIRILGAYLNSKSSSRSGYKTTEPKRQPKLEGRETPNLIYQGKKSWHLVQTKGKRNGTFRGGRDMDRNHICAEVTLIPTQNDREGKKAAPWKK